MQNMKNLLIGAACMAVCLASFSARADNPNNVCKPGDGSTDTVVCSWPHDPGTDPMPDIADCQEHLRVPTSTNDDCGNSDFMSCMQDKGFECSDNKS